MSDKLSLSVEVLDLDKAVSQLRNFKQEFNELRTSFEDAPSMTGALNEGLERASSIVDMLQEKISKARLNNRTDDQGFVQDVQSGLKELGAMSSLFGQDGAFGASFAKSIVDGFSQTIRQQLSAETGELSSMLKAQASRLAGLTAKTAAGEFVKSKPFEEFFMSKWHGGISRSDVYQKYVEALIPNVLPAFNTAEYQRARYGHILRNNNTAAQPADLLPASFRESYRNKGYTSMAMPSGARILSAYNRTQLRDLIRDNDEAARAAYGVKGMTKLEDNGELSLIREITPQMLDDFRRNLFTSFVKRASGRDSQRVDIFKGLEDMTSKEARQLVSRMTSSSAGRLLSIMSDIDGIGTDKDWSDAGSLGRGFEKLGRSTKHMLEQYEIAKYTVGDLFNNTGKSSRVMLSESQNTRMLGLEGQHNDFTDKVIFVSADGYDRNDPKQQAFVEELLSGKAVPIGPSGKKYIAQNMHGTGTHAGVRMVEQQAYEAVMKREQEWAQKHGFVTADGKGANFWNDFVDSTYEFKDIEGLRKHFDATGKGWSNSWDTHGNFKNRNFAVVDLSQINDENVKQKLADGIGWFMDGILPEKDFQGRMGVAGKGTFHQISGYKTVGEWAKAAGLTDANGRFILPGVGGNIDLTESPYHGFVDVSTIKNMQAYSNFHTPEEISKGFTAMLQHYGMSSMQTYDDAETKAKGIGTQAMAFMNLSPKMRQQQIDEFNRRISLLSSESGIREYLFADPDNYLGKQIRSGKLAVSSNAVQNWVQNEIESLTERMSSGEWIDFGTNPSVMNQTINKNPIASLLGFDNINGKSRAELLQEVRKRYQEKTGTALNISDKDLEGVFALNKGQIVDFSRPDEERVAIQRSPSLFGNFVIGKNYANLARDIYKALGDPDPQGVFVSEPDLKTLGGADLDGDKAKTIYGDLAEAFSEVVSIQEKAIKDFEGTTDPIVKKVELPGAAAKNVDNTLHRRLYFEASQDAVQEMGSADAAARRAAMFDIYAPENKDLLAAAIQSNYMYEEATAGLKHATQTKATPQMLQALYAGAQWSKLPSHFSRLFNTTGRDNMDIPSPEDIFTANVNGHEIPINMKELRALDFDKINFRSIFNSTDVGTMRAVSQVASKGVNMDRTYALLQALDHMGYGGAGETTRALMKNLRTMKAYDIANPMAPMSAEELNDLQMMIQAAKREIEEEAYQKAQGNKIKMEDGSEVFFDTYVQKKMNEYGVTAAQGFVERGINQPNIRSVFHTDDPTKLLPELFLGQKGGLDFSFAGKDAVLQREAVEKKLQENQAELQRIEIETKQHEEQMNQIKSTLPQEDQARYSPDMTKEEAVEASKRIFAVGGDLAKAEAEAAQVARVYDEVDQLAADSGVDTQAYRDAIEQRQRILDENAQLGKAYKYIQAQEHANSLQLSVDNIKQQYLTGLLKKENELEGKSQAETYYNSRSANIGFVYRQLKDFIDNSEEFEELPGKMKQNFKELVGGRSDLMRQMNQDFADTTELKAKRLYENLNKTNRKRANKVSALDVQFEEYDNQLQAVEDYRNELQKHLQDREKYPFNPAERKLYEERLAETDTYLAGAREETGKMKEADITNLLDRIKGTVIQDPFQQLKQGANEAKEVVSQLSERLEKVYKDQGMSDEEVAKKMEPYSVLTQQIDENTKFQQQHLKLQDRARVAQVLSTYMADVDKYDIDKEKSFLDFREEQARINRKRQKTGFITEDEAKIISTTFEDYKRQYDEQNLDVSRYLEGVEAVRDKAQKNVDNARKIADRIRKSNLTQEQKDERLKPLERFNDDYVEREEAAYNEHIRQRQKQAELRGEQEIMQAQRAEMRVEQMNRNWNMRGATDRFSRGLLQRYSMYNQFKNQEDQAKINIASTEERIKQLQYQKDHTEDKESQRTIQGQIDSATKSLNSYRAALANAQSGMRQFTNSSGQFAQIMNPVVSTFDALAQSADKLIASFGRKLFSSIFNEAKNFVTQYDGQMRTIQAITMKTDEEMEAVRQNTIDRAIDLKARVSDVASVEADMYRQGLDDQQVEERSEAIMKFSTVTGAKVTDSGKAITTAIQNGLVDSAEEAMDVLTALGDTAATTANEIFKGMQKSAAAAKVAGVSYEELTTLLTIGTSKTQLSGQVVGTGLQTIFSRMNRVTNEGYYNDETGASVTINDVEKALSSAGISLRTNNGKSFRNSFEVLRDLSKVWNSLSDIQRSNITYTMAGGRQTNMFQSLMEGMGEDGGAELARLLGMAENSEGTTESKYQIAVQGISGAINELKSTYDGLVASVSDNNVFVDMIGGVTSLVGGLKDLSTNSAGIVTAIAAIGAAIVGLGIKIAAVNSIKGGAAGLISTLIGVAGAGLILGGSSLIGSIMQANKEANDPELQQKKAEEQAESFYKTQQDRLKPLNNQIEEVEKLGKAWEDAGKKSSGQEYDALEAKLNSLAATMNTVSDSFDNGAASVENWKQASEELQSFVNNTSINAAALADKVKDKTLAKNAREIFEDYQAMLEIAQTKNISNDAVIEQLSNAGGFLATYNTNTLREWSQYNYDGNDKNTLKDEIRSLSLGDNQIITEDDINKWVDKEEYTPVRIGQNLDIGKFMRYIAGEAPVFDSQFDSLDKDFVDSFRRTFNAYKEQGLYDTELAQLGIGENEDGTLNASLSQWYTIYEDMMNQKNRFMTNDQITADYKSSARKLAQNTLANSSQLDYIFKGNKDAINKILERELADFDATQFKSNGELYAAITNRRQAIAAKYAGVYGTEWMNQLLNPGSYAAQVTTNKEGKEFTFGTNALNPNSSDEEIKAVIDQFNTEYEALQEANEIKGTIEIILENRTDTSATVSGQTDKSGVNFQVSGGSGGATQEPAKKEDQTPPPQTTTTQPPATSQTTTVQPQAAASTGKTRKVNAPIGIIADATVSDIGFGPRPQQDVSQMNATALRNRYSTIDQLFDYNDELNELMETYGADYQADIAKLQELDDGTESTENYNRIFNYIYAKHRQHYDALTDKVEQEAAAKAAKEQSELLTETNAVTEPVAPEPEIKNDNILTPIVKLFDELSTPASGEEAFDLKAIERKAKQRERINATIEQLEKQDEADDAAYKLRLLSNEIVELSDELSTPSSGEDAFDIKTLERKAKQRERINAIIEQLEQQEEADDAAYKLGLLSSKIVNLSDELSIPSSEKETSGVKALERKAQQEEKTKAQAESENGGTANERAQQSTAKTTGEQAADNTVEEKPYKVTYTPRTTLSEILKQTTQSAKQQDLTEQYGTLLGYMNQNATLADVETALEKGQIDAKDFTQIFSSNANLRKIADDLLNNKGTKQYTDQDFRNALQEAYYGYTLQTRMPQITSSAYTYDKTAAALQAIENGTANSEQYSMIAQRYGIDERTLRLNSGTYTPLVRSQLNMDRSSLEQNAASDIAKGMETYLKDNKEDVERDLLDYTGQDSGFDMIWNNYLATLSGDALAQAQQLMQSYTSSGYTFSYKNGAIKATRNGQEIEVEDLFNPDTWNRSVGRQQTLKDLRDYLNTGKIYDSEGKELGKGAEQTRRFNAMSSYSSTFSQLISLEESATEEAEKLKAQLEFEVSVDGLDQLVDLGQMSQEALNIVQQLGKGGTKRFSGMADAREYVSNLQNQIGLYNAERTSENMEAVRESLKMDYDEFYGDVNAAYEKYFEFVAGQEARTAMENGFANMYNNATNKADKAEIRQRAERLGASFIEDQESGEAVFRFAQDFWQNIFKQEESLAAKPNEWIRTDAEKRALMMSIIGSDETIAELEKNSDYRNLLKENSTLLQYRKLLDAGYGRDNADVIRLRKELETQYTQNPMAGYTRNLQSGELLDYVNQIVSAGQDGLNVFNQIEDVNIQNQLKNFSGLADYMSEFADKGEVAAKTQRELAKSISDTTIQALEEEGVVLSGLSAQLDTILGGNVLDSTKQLNQFAQSMANMTDVQEAYQNIVKGTGTSKDWDLMQSEWNFSDDMKNQYILGLRKLQADYGDRMSRYGGLQTNTVENFAKQTLRNIEGLSIYRDVEVAPTNLRDRIMQWIGLKKPTTKREEKSLDEILTDITAEQVAAANAQFAGTGISITRDANGNYVLGGTVGTRKLTSAEQYKIGNTLYADQAEDFKALYNQAIRAGAFAPQTTEALAQFATMRGLNSDEMQAFFRSDEYQALASNDIGGALSLLYSKGFGGTRDTGIRITDQNIQEYISRILNGDKSVVSALNNDVDARDFITSLDGFSDAMNTLQSGGALEQYQIDALNSSIAYRRVYESERNGLYRKGAAEFARTMATGTNEERYAAMSQQSAERTKYAETSDAISAILQNQEADNETYWQQIQKNQGLNDNEIAYYKKHVNELEDLKNDADKQIGLIDAGLKEAIASMFNVSDFNELGESGHETLLAAAKRLFNLDGLDIEKDDNGNLTITEDKRTPWEILTSNATSQNGYASEKEVRQAWNNFADSVQKASTVSDIENIANGQFADNKGVLSKLLEAGLDSMIEKLISGDYTIEDFKEMVTQGSGLASLYRSDSFNNNYEAAKGIFGDGFGYASELNVDPEVLKGFLDSGKGQDVADWIKSLEGGPQLLQDLTDKGKAFGETAKVFNENFQKERTKNIRQWGQATDEVAETVANLGKDARTATQTVGTLVSRINKVNDLKVAADKARGKTGAQLDGKTRNMLSSATGIDSKTIKGMTESAVNDLADMVDESAGEEFNDIGKIIMQRFQDTVNQAIANNEITIDQALKFDLNTDGKIDASEVAKAASQLTDQELAFLASYAGLVGTLTGQITEGDNSVSVSNILTSALGKGGYSGGGGGGGGGGKKSDAQKLLERLKREQAQRNHEIKMIQYQETKYENAGEIGNQNRMIELENEAQKRLIKTLENSIKKSRAQMAKVKKNSDDWKNLYDAVLSYEEAIEEANNTIAENTKKIEENEQAILKLHTDLEQEVNTEIENRIQRQRDMLAGTVSMEDTILEAIRQRYRDEWELVREDIEKKKEALEEEKSLIDERLQRRKDAEDEAEKYEELQEYKKQLALIQMDSTRTKDAAKLREQIAKLEKELAWDIAEDEADYQKEQIDEQIDAYDDFLNYGEEDLEDWLADANNMAEEVNSVLQLSQEGIMQWLRDNVKDYALAMDEAQTQMVQGWTDTWEQMVGYTHTYWEEIADTLSGKTLFINYMQQSQDYINASEDEQKQMLYEWEQMYDNWLAAQKRDAVYSHSDNWSSGLGTSGSKSGGGSSNKLVTAESDFLMKTFAELEQKYGASSMDEKTSSPVSITSYDFTNGVINLLKDNIPKKYASGGVVDYTGPAWVDGTPTRPESFLDADDTQLMRTMLDEAKYVRYRATVSSIDSSKFSGNSQNIGELVINITEAQFKDDADFDEVANRVGEKFVKELSKQGFHTMSYAF